MKPETGKILKRATACALLAALAASGLPHPAAAQTEQPHRCHPPAALDQASIAAPAADQHCSSRHRIACAMMPGCAAVTAALILAAPDGICQLESHPVNFAEAPNLTDRTSGGPPTPPPDLR
jgi:hypothetical protein